MPFSDNLYSMVDDDSDTEPIGRPEEQPENDEHWDQSVTGDGADYEAFSPTDGYFHSASTAPASSNVPHVPNVWVRDPSLEQGSAADSKAREAHREALGNDHHPLNSPGVSRLQPSTSSGDDHSTYSYPYQPAHRGSTSNSSRATHYQPSVAAYTPSTTASYTSDAPRRQGPNQRSPFLPQDAPPAYTPSPTTSPTSSPSQTTRPRNYQTFLQPNMGREEAQGLLAHNPESMGSPDDELRGIMPAWSERARRRHPYLNGRNCRVMLLGLALLAITIGFLVSSITSVRNEVSRHCCIVPPSRLRIHIIIVISIVGLYIYIYIPTNPHHLSCRLRQCTSLTKLPPSLKLTIPTESKTSLFRGTSSSQPTRRWPTGRRPT